jgi:hypothetical protein
LWIYISQPKNELKKTKEKLKEYKNKHILENEIGITFKFYNDRNWDQLTERKNIIDAADFIRNLNNYPPLCTSLSSRTHTDSTRL